MRVYISIDMEGVAGIVHPDQCRRGRGGYEEARELMTHEANAAALGAFEGGATDVLINDSHGDMRSLRFDQLDPRVQVLSGNLKPFSMAAGLEHGNFDLALFVGYHGGAGTQNSILDHTYRSSVVGDLRINGRSCNEAALNAMVAGYRGAPVGLVTGDENACHQCKELLGDVDTVTVKWAVGRMAARSLHPHEARAKIRAGAQRAVRERDRFAPFVLDPPYQMELDVLSTSVADAIALMPGVERPSPRTLTYEAPDVPTMFRAMLTMVRLGGTGVV